MLEEAEIECPRPLAEIAAEAGALIEDRVAALEGEPSTPPKGRAILVPVVPAVSPHHEFINLGDSIGALNCFYECAYKWRFPISAEAANYLHEGLWLRVNRQGSQ